MTATAMSEAEASFMKRGVQNRLDHVEQGRLHDSISHGGYTQRPFLRTARFRNPGSTHCRRGIAPLAQLPLQSLEFLPLAFGEIARRLPINARSTFLVQHFAGRTVKVHLAKHLVDQRVPFPSFHSIFQKCRQHAICPNRPMSPLVNARCLSSRYSRERHCDRDVISLPLGRRFTVRRFGHLVSTFLLPLAPPCFAARLRRYYESSDYCRAASSDVAGIALFVPRRQATPRRGAWAIGHAASRTAISDDASSASCARQFSLLIAFDLPTIPPPTTALPFRHGRFGTLRHRRDLPRLSPGQTLLVGGNAVARSRVRAFLEASPTGLAESSSLSLRTGRSSQVALHLSSGDAVTTFDYRPVTLA